MSAQTTERLMTSDVRLDYFNGCAVHTFRRKGRPCWMLFEIERALGEEIEEFTSAGFEPIPGDDFELLRVEDFARFRPHSGEPPAGARGAKPLTLLYEAGLTIACGASPLRRQLLTDIRKGERALEKARLETRVREVLREIEREDRTRKAARLYWLVDHARRCGPLRGDDAGYVEAMAVVAELATGMVFPAGTPTDDAIASALGEHVSDVRDAMGALAKDTTD